MSNNWQEKIEEYCKKYNIPILYLADTLYEPKVIPMIRGMSFEFSVIMMLQGILHKNEWMVHKVSVGEELSFHDTDVRTFHKRTGKAIRVECKLAKKEGYRQRAGEHSEIYVKCMRSRTLGLTKVKELAPKFGVDEQSLAVHNDQYLSADFDVVVTSIANAFYRTDRKTGLTEFNPTDSETEFLQLLKPSSGEDLKDFAFRRMYVARSIDLTVRPENGITCSRAKCDNKTSCRFIPNYPVIHFDASGKTTNGWIPIEESANAFRRFIS